MSGNGNNDDSIIEEQQGSIKIVRFNRPKKKNAINSDMFLRITKILEDAAEDNSITVTVFTGTGDFYSSGYDLKEALVTKHSDNFLVVLRNFLDAFIKFPKILVGIVNGPAVGVAVTTLALFDVVFATEESFFYTPFAKLGVSAEGGSSFTFPKLIGDRKAMEMLLFNYRMPAQEALNHGLINYIYKPEELKQAVWDKIHKMCELPSQAILTSKKLMRQITQEELLKANEREIEALRNLRKQSDVQTYMDNRSKL